MSLSGWRLANILSRLLGFAALSVVVAACALPAAGPTAQQVENPLEGPSFTLVKLDQRVVDILLRTNPNSFAPKFQGRRYVASNALRRGDSIAVTVYETGGTSLFGAPTANPAPTGTSPGTVTTVPPQVIEADGYITMPFVGRIRALDRTPGQLGQDIANALKGKAIDPQVIVTLVNNGGNTATVGGDVAQPRPVALTLRGERLLDVIAQAGGARFPPYETYVRVVRNGQIGTILLQTVISSPNENIVVKPNDQIFLVRNPRTFSILGASQKVSQYTFDTDRVTLAEAVARSGGPIDQIGDPTGVYLFRYESWQVARLIWKDLPPQMLVDGRPPEFVPILYRVDLGDAGGYFLSQRVYLRDKDVVLFTNAEATQLQKALGIVRNFTGIAFDLSRTGN